jgi:hypothetical protein
VSAGGRAQDPRPTDDHHRGMPAHGHTTHCTGQRQAQDPGSVQLQYVSGCPHVSSGHARSGPPGAGRRQSPRGADVPAPSRTAPSRRYRDHEPRPRSAQWQRAWWSWNWSDVPARDGAGTSAPRGLCRRPAPGGPLRAGRSDQSQECGPRRRRRHLPTQLSRRHRVVDITAPPGHPAARPRLQKLRPTYATSSWEESVSVVARTETWPRANAAVRSPVDVVPVHTVHTPARTR